MFWWLYNWVLHHRQNHSRMWGWVSSCIVCSSSLWLFFHLKTLFSKQSKWAELMPLMEIKLPSKSQAVFYEMQNELLALQQSKDTEKTCVCYFGAFCSHLTGLHSSLSWAEEILKSLGWLSDGKCIALISSTLSYSIQIALWSLTQVPAPGAVLPTEKSLSKCQDRSFEVQCWDWKCRNSKIIFI